MWLRIAQKHEVGLLREPLINKYAGHDEQLGFRKGMDEIRIAILEKIIDNCAIEDKRELLQRELNEKNVNGGVTVTPTLVGKNSSKDTGWNRRYSNTDFSRYNVHA